MTPSFTYAARTDVGTVRTNNEDAAFASPSLLVLADGMGGHAAGEVASAVVLHALVPLETAPIATQGVLDATQHARDALRAMSQADPDMDGMGTTLVALGVSEEGICLAHVGDSRIYRLRGGVLDQITVDHTHVQRLVDSGRLDPREIRTHPYRSVILRSIDDTSDDLPDVAITAAIEPGDRVLLCSDGLSDYLPLEVLHSELAVGQPDEAANALIQAALAAGTRDNVTVVVADVQGPDTTRVSAPVTERVGARLADAVLSGPARAALSRMFPEVEPSPDTLPREEAGINTPAAGVPVGRVADGGVPVGGVPAGGVPAGGVPVGRISPYTPAVVAPESGGEVASAVEAGVASAAELDPAGDLGVGADLDSAHSESPADPPFAVPDDLPFAAAEAGTAGTGGPSEERVEAVGVGDATPAPAPRLSRRDGLWLALVAITFAATNAAVLFLTL